MKIFVNPKLKKLELRPYTAADCAAVLQLFRSTVHSVNCKDYTALQCQAWASEEIDSAAWNASLLAHHTLVAHIGSEIIGFADIDGGYLDRLYVHKNFQRQGVATALADTLEQHAVQSEHRILTVHASITAKAFFEKRGYAVLCQQQVLCRGVEMTNFQMQKNIPV